MTDEITTKEVNETQNVPVSESTEPTIPSEPEIQTVDLEPTAQIPVSEPLPTPTETSSEIIPEPAVETVTTETKPVGIEIQPEPVPELVKEEVKPEISEPVNPEQKQGPITESEQPKIIPVIIPSKNLARELLVKARSAIQSRKRKKLDKIMTLFAKQTKITNDEVEKFMHVSDATATRYLNTLEKENKIKQTGKTGKSVFYSKI